MVLDHEGTIPRSRCIWEIVKNGYVDPTGQEAYKSLTHAENDALKDQRKKDGKTMFYIHQSMHESILPRVASTKKSKEAWDILKTTY